MWFADKPRRSAMGLYCEVMNKVTRHTSLVRCGDYVRTISVAAMTPQLRPVLYMHNICRACLTFMDVQDWAEKRAIDVVERKLKGIESSDSCRTPQQPTAELWH